MCLILLHTLLCFLKILMRITMTVLVMLDNIFRSALKVVYNALSMLLSLLNVIPAMLIVVAAFRLKCITFCGENCTVLRHSNSAERCFYIVITVLTIYALHEKYDFWKPIAEHFGFEKRIDSRTVTLPPIQSKGYKLPWWQVLKTKSHLLTSNGGSKSILPNPSTIIYDKPIYTTLATKYFSKMLHKLKTTITTRTISNYEKLLFDSDNWLTLIKNNAKSTITQNLIKTYEDTSNTAVRMQNDNLNTVSNSRKGMTSKNYNISELADGKYNVKDLFHLNVENYSDHLQNKDEDQLHTKISPIELNHFSGATSNKRNNTSSIYFTSIMNKTNITELNNSTIVLNEGLNITSLSLDNNTYLNVLKVSKNITNTSLKHLITLIMHETTTIKSHINSSDGYETATEMRTKSDYLSTMVLTVNETRHLWQNITDNSVQYLSIQTNAIFENVSLVDYRISDKDKEVPVTLNEKKNLEFNNTKKIISESTMDIFSATTDNFNSEFFIETKLSKNSEEKLVTLCNETLPYVDINAYSEPLDTLFSLGTSDIDSSSQIKLESTNVDYFDTSTTYTDKDFQYNVVPISFFTSTIKLNAQDSVIPIIFSTSTVEPDTIYDYLQESATPMKLSIGFIEISTFQKHLQDKVKLMQFQTSTVETVNIYDNLKDTQTEFFSSRIPNKTIYNTLQINIIPLEFSTSTTDDILLENLITIELTTSTYGTDVYDNFQENFLPMEFTTTTVETDSDYFIIFDIPKQTKVLDHGFFSTRKKLFNYFFSSNTESTPQEYSGRRDRKYDEISMESSKNSGKTMKIAPFKVSDTKTQHWLIIESDNTNTLASAITTHNSENIYSDFNAVSAEVSSNAYEFDTKNTKKTYEFKTNHKSDMSNRLHEKTSAVLNIDENPDNNETNTELQTLSNKPQKPSNIAAKHENRRRLFNKTYPFYKRTQTILDTARINSEYSKILIKFLSKTTEFDRKRPEKISEIMKNNRQKIKTDKRKQFYKDISTIFNRDSNSKDYSDISFILFTKFEENETTRPKKSFGITTSDHRSVFDKTDKTDEKSRIPLNTKSNSLFFNEISIDLLTTVKQMEIKIPRKSYNVTRKQANYIKSNATVEPHKKTRISNHIDYINLDFNNIFTKLSTNSYQNVKKKSKKSFITIKLKSNNGFGSDSRLITQSFISNYTSINNAYLNDATVEILKKFNFQGTKHKKVPKIQRKHKNKILKTLSSSADITDDIRSDYTKIPLELFRKPINFGFKKRKKISKKNFFEDERLVVSANVSYIGHNPQSIKAIKSKNYEGYMQYEHSIPTDILDATIIEMHIENTTKNINNGSFTIDFRQINILNDDKIENIYDTVDITSTEESYNYSSKFDILYDRYGKESLAINKLKKDGLIKRNYAFNNKVDNKKTHAFKIYDIPLESTVNYDDHLFIDNVKYLITTPRTNGFMNINYDTFSSTESRMKTNNDIFYKYHILPVFKKVMQRKIH